MRQVITRIFTTTHHSDQEKEKFKELGLELINFDPKFKNEIEYLIIGKEDASVEWAKIFTESKLVKYISWGTPQNIDSFLLHHGHSIVSPKQFAENLEYRKLFLHNINKENSLHLQDKFESSFDQIIKATILHPLRFGGFIDILTAYALEKDFSIVPLRHFAESTILFLAHLKQLDKIHFPVNVEYAANDKMFVVNLSVTAPSIMLEYLLEFLKQPGGAPRKDNLLSEILRSSHLLEVSHFKNAQKLNISVSWFKESDCEPSFHLYEVESARSFWNNSNAPEVINSDELFNEAEWEEIEQKKLPSNFDIELPQLDPSSAISKSPNKLKALMAEIVLQKLNNDPDHVEEELTSEEARQLLEDSEAGEWFEELSEEDQENVIKSINNPATKGKVLKELGQVKDELDSNEEHQEQKKKKFKKDAAELIANSLDDEQLDEVIKKSKTIKRQQLTEDEVEEVLGEQPLLKQKINNILDELPEVDVKKQKKIKKILAEEKVNLDHPFLAQALDEMDEEELENAEVVSDKLAKITEFVKKNAELKKPKTQRALDAFINNEISFSELEEFVEEEDAGQFDDIPVEEIAAAVINKSQKQKKKELIDENESNNSESIIADALDAVQSILDDKVEEKTSANIQAAIETAIAAGDFSPEEKDQVVESVAEILSLDPVFVSSGENAEEVAREVVSGVCQALDEETQKISASELDQDQTKKIIKSKKSQKDKNSIVSGGNSEDEEESQKVSGFEPDEDNTKKVVKGQKAKKQKNLLFSDPTESEDEEVRKIISNAVTNNKDSLKTIKGIEAALDEASLQSGNYPKELVKKQKNLFAQKIAQSLEAVSQKLNKPLDQLTDEEINTHSQEVITGVTEQIKEERQMVRAQFVDKALNEKTIIPDSGSLNSDDKTIVSDLSHSDKIDFAKKIISDQVLNNIEGQSVESIVSNPNLLNSLNQLTKASPKKIQVAVQQAVAEVDDAEMRQIIDQVSALSQFQVPEVMADFKIELYESEKDNGNLSGSSSKTVVSDKGPKQEKVSQTVREAEVAPEPLAHDNTMFIKFKKAEEDRKKLQQENLKLKAELETRVIKDRVQEKVQNKLVDKQVVPGHVDPEPRAFGNNFKEIVKDNFEKTPSKNVKEIVRENPGKEKDQSSVSKDHPDLKKLELTLKQQELEFEEELRKLSLDNERKALQAEKLKQANTQLTENFTKKIKTLEMELNAKPMVREIVHADPSENPELYRMKDENEKLKKLMERYKDKVSELAQKATPEAKVDRSINDFADKKKLEREIYDLKEKLKSAKEQEMPASTNTVKEPKAKPVFERRDNPNERSDARSATREEMPNSSARPIENTVREKSQTSNENAPDLKLVKELRDSKDDNLKLKRELIKAQNELAQNQSKSSNHSAENNVSSGTNVAAKEKIVSESIPAETSKQLQQSQKEITELKKKLNDESKHKTFMENRVQELEKTLELLSEDNDQASPQAQKESGPSVNKNNDPAPTLSNQSDAKVKKIKMELAELSLKYSKNQNELNDVKSQLKSLLEKNNQQKENTVIAEIKEKSTPEVVAPIANAKNVAMDAELKRELTDANNKIVGYKNTISQLEKQIESMFENQAGPSPVAAAPTAAVAAKPEANMNDSEIKKELAKARESEQNFKRDLAAAQSKLSMSENKAKDLEEKLNSILAEGDGPAAVSGAPGNKSQVGQLQASNKKLVSDLMKAQQLVAESKKEVNAARADKVTLQNKVTQLQKDLDKLKKPRAA